MRIPAHVARVGRGLEKKRTNFLQSLSIKRDCGGRYVGFRELHLVPQANENKHRVFVAFQHF